MGWLQWLKTCRGQSLCFHPEFSQGLRMVVMGVVVTVVMGVVGVLTLARLCGMPGTVL